jgi:hypothetical protein
MSFTKPSHNGGQDDDQFEAGLFAAGVALLISIFAIPPVFAHNG